MMYAPPASSPPKLKRLTLDLLYFPFLLIEMATNVAEGVGPDNRGRRLRLMKDERGRTEL